MRSPWLNKLSFIFGHKLPLNCLLLCILSVFAVVAICGSRSNVFEFATPTPVSVIYGNYRRLKEKAAVDYSDLKFISSIPSSQRELSLCAKERENYAPCYNVSANLFAGFKDGEEFDRHCEVSRQEEHCLVRPPKDYKIPLRWPAGRDVIWSGNVKISKDQFLSSGSMTKRLMLLEENQISFHSEDGLVFDGVKDYSRQVAEMIGLGSDSEFPQAGVRTVLDIDCGFGSFGAHLLSLNVMAICIAKYEATGSQVQLALERGLPALIGSFVSRQLPYPSLSFDMVHCAQCGIGWDNKGGMFLIEVDRILKPGGYFVLTSPTSKPLGSLSNVKTSMIAVVEELAKGVCWKLQGQQDETFIWQKVADTHCYASRKHGAIPLCKEDHDVQNYYQLLAPCISGTTSRRWIPVQNRSSYSHLTAADLEVHGKYLSSNSKNYVRSAKILAVQTRLLNRIQSEDFFEDAQFWRSSLKDYWSLLTPLIFSDHPKRLGDEDPLPPYNMIHNVMDMNANYGGLSAAFVEEKKSAWVMNVVPFGSPNTLPVILDQGFAGILHDWCEPFPTYPRTYDMVHANELFSHFASERCSMMDLIVEIDRMLRPEGWVILSDKVDVVEMARMLAIKMRWEARVIDPQNGSDQRLLVCQKPFLKK